MIGWIHQWSHLVLGFCCYWGVFIIDSISVLVISLSYDSLFVLESVLVLCVFLGICPRYLILFVGKLFFTMSYNSSCEGCGNVPTLISDSCDLRLPPRPPPPATTGLAIGLSVLLIFSKDQLLGLLIFLTVFLLSISVIDTLNFTSSFWSFGFSCPYFFFFLMS